jgi:hypothetical protein
MNINNSQQRNSLSSGTGVNLDAGGKWWRFSRYRLDGDRLRPAKGSHLIAYDPWREYRRVEARTRGGKLQHPPYQPLLDLAFALRKSREETGLATSERESILAWCNDNGLFGLLFLEVQQIATIPRWRSDAQGRVVPERNRHFRYLHRWRSVQESNHSTAVLTLPASEKELGELVPEKYWLPSWSPRGAMVRNWRRGGIEEKMIGKALSQFFPDVDLPEVYEYPVPMSPEFWSQYSEPLREFVGHALQFSEILRRLAQIRAQKEMTETDRAEAVEASEVLQAYAADAGIGLYPQEDGTLARQWVAHSLIASFATMALLDLADSLVNVCENCSRVFVSSAGRARFCSPTCRRTLLQREWRARKK